MSSFDEFIERLRTAELTLEVPAALHFDGPQSREWWAQLVGRMHFKVDGVPYDVPIIIRLERLVSRE